MALCLGYFFQYALLYSNVHYRNYKVSEQYGHVYLVVLHIKLFDTIKALPTPLMETS